MRTASCLTLIAIGAIFTFAVTAHPDRLAAPADDPGVTGCEHGGADSDGV